jgi:hypothetical protein
MVMHWSPYCGAMCEASHQGAKLDCLYFAAPSALINGPDDEGGPARVQAPHISSMRSALSGSLQRCGLSTQSPSAAPASRRVGGLFLDYAWMWRTTTSTAKPPPASLQHTAGHGRHVSGTTHRPVLAALEASADMRMAALLAAAGGRTASAVAKRHRLLARVHKLLVLLGFDSPRLVRMKPQHLLLERTPDLRKGCVGLDAKCPSDLLRQKAVP